jgi:aspartate kinase
VLQGLGVPARLFLGHQVRIETDSAYGRARIVRIDADRLRGAPAGGAVASSRGSRASTPGRQHHDPRRGGWTPARWLAAALGRRLRDCTDVDGVFTSDPRIVPRARKLERISYEEMLELASLGAKVLQIRSVEFAMRYRVPVHVRSSFNDTEGTRVVEEDSSMEEHLGRGRRVRSERGQAPPSGVPDHPGRGPALRSGRRGRYRRRHDHPRTPARTGPPT